MVEFGLANSIDEAKAQLRQVGSLTGHPDRADAVIATIDAAIGRVRDVAARRRRLTILPLQRRGWVSGRETLTTSLLDVVGLQNAGADLSLQGRRVSLEAIVRLKPDLLLVSENEKAEDQGSALLQHPALERLYPPWRRLVLPDTMTECGGPEIGPALDMLAAEIANMP